MNDYKMPVKAKILGIVALVLGIYSVTVCSALFISRTILSYTFPSDFLFIFIVIFLPFPIAGLIISNKAKEKGNIGKIPAAAKDLSIAALIFFAGVITTTIINLFI